MQLSSSTKKNTLNLLSLQKNEENIHTVLSNFILEVGKLKNQAPRRLKGKLLPKIKCNETTKYAFGGVVCFILVLDRILTRVLWQVDHSRIDSPTMMEICICL